MTEKILNIEGHLMTDTVRTAWHYVMDIHDPENYWYSLGLIGK